MSESVSTGLATRPRSLTNSQLALLQAISGALFSVFLLLHLGNTLLAIFGNEIYDKFQQFIQGFYQQPLFELIFVFAPLLVHVGAGITLLIRNRNRKASTTLSQRLHSWGGIYLLLVLIGHVGATRGIGLITGSDIGFGGLAFSLWWKPAWFYPYYFLMFMAGLYHVLFGLSRVISRMGIRPSKVSATLFRGTLALGVLGAILALLSIGGQRYEIHDPTDNNYARFYAEHFGVDLKRDK